jgi:phospholipid/cholesterol/gamma-HCH transport system substrate-binding protein
MTTSRTRRLLLLGLAVVLVVAVVIVWVTVADKKPAITVTFPDASGITLGYQVKSHGAPVGSVSTVRVVNGQAEVGLDVNDSVFPLHTDATAWIRPLNLLGERYIELDSGTPDAPEMSEPYHIAPDHTKTSTTLQDVLNTLDNPTSTSLAAVATSLGEGVQDSGPQAADAIKALAPAMTDTQRLTGILNQQNAILNQLVDHTSPVAKAVGADGSKPLDQLLDVTNQTLGTVTANRQAVDATLAELPATLDSAQRTLDQLTGTAQAATPTLASIRPTTDNLTQISKELENLSDAADPAVTSLKPVVQHADELLDQAGPAVAALKPAGPQLADAATKLQPVAAQLLDEHLRDLLDFVRLWSLSTNGRDGLSNYFRGVVHVTPQYLGVVTGDIPLTGGLLGQAAGPTLAGTAIPALPGALAGAGNATSTLQSALTPGGQLTAPASPPDAGAPAPTSDPSNATGLTAGQEQSMLSQMIGGR